MAEPQPQVVSLLRNSINSTVLNLPFSISTKAWSTLILCSRDIDFFRIIFKQHFHFQLIRYYWTSTTNIFPCSFNFEIANKNIVFYFHDTAMGIVAQCYGIIPLFIRCYQWLRLHIAWAYERDVEWAMGGIEFVFNNANIHLQRMCLSTSTVSIAILYFVPKTKTPEKWMKYT